MNRRKFLENTGLMAAGLGLAGSEWCSRCFCQQQYRFCPLGVYRRFWHPGIRAYWCGLWRLVWP